MDGLTTYLDLVSLLIEEKHDGAAEARRIADKYGAQVVGAIPPLNVYQLRLPVRDLVQRDALVLRLGTEVSVDAVIVEESAPNAARRVMVAASRPSTRQTSGPPTVSWMRCTSTSAASLLPGCRCSQYGWA